MNVNTLVACPECGAQCRVTFNRKRGTVKIECDECSERNEIIPDYDETVVIGDV